MVQRRLRDRFHHLRLRRRVDHRVELLASKEVADALAVADVRDDEPHRGIEVRAVAGREVVEDEHVVAARPKRVDDVRSEEPGTAGDQNAHRVIPLRCGQQCGRRRMRHGQVNAIWGAPAPGVVGKGLAGTRPGA